MARKQAEEVKEEYSGPMLPGYFQGASAAYTGYDDVYTGCGSTLHDAFEDAVETLAFCESLDDQVFAEIGEASDHFPRNVAVEEDGGGPESMFYVMVYIEWREDEDGENESREKAQ